MIKATPLKVIHWEYNPPAKTVIAEDSYKMIPLQSIKKTDASGKGIGMRFHHRRFIKNDTILSYIAELSYVMDEVDIVDEKEMLTMFRNAYNQYQAQFFNLSKGTPLSPLKAWDESKLNLASLLSLLE